MLGQHCWRPTFDADAHTSLTDALIQLEQSAAGGHQAERGFSSDLWRVFHSAIYDTMKQRINTDADLRDALAAWTNMSVLIVQLMHQGYAQGIRQLQSPSAAQLRDTALARQ